ncbi:hypothetical protein [Kitasatospora sp. MMS16-BH015]|uniref:hypothetical protein n=1 Tax=Kitasatospora sp. MMS16-BH015 TaxID=2018025 RepID=UPI00131A527C|nr:hypothetical protein [Kitasatospora sp. MMS16-BH015]
MEQLHSTPARSPCQDRVTLMEKIGPEMAYRTITPASAIGFKEAAIFWGAALVISGVAYFRYSAQKGSGGRPESLERARTIFIVVALFTGLAAAAVTITAISNQ